ncbi:DUF1707 SHOCT-like domain-containing protein [Nocardioides donggukensis]|uniref:DUF1707 SHOCT-like domain-containing protein n=1 Tax=Nocardioides donggukensis TaxID=2774019 RepID=UPI00191D2489|nr:DUF1707 domain-containing protein [Nocardioides donggukensis]
MTEPDPARLRISDSDRHQVAELLREAAAEGRLDWDELEERLEATYAAKVAGDLVPIVADLPGSPPAVSSEAHPAVPRPPLLPAGSRHDFSLAVMSGQDRRGVWEIGPSHTAFAMMGGVTLDLREARFAAPEVVVTAVAVMGGIDVHVNAGTRIAVEGLGVMGSFDEARPKVAAEIAADAPLVRVRGLALMGAVTVQRRAMPGESRRGRRALR